MTVGQKQKTYQTRCSFKISLYYLSDCRSCCRVILCCQFSSIMPRTIFFISPVYSFDSISRFFFYRLSLGESQGLSRHISSMRVRPSEKMGDVKMGGAWKVWRRFPSFGFGFGWYLMMEGCRNSGAMQFVGGSWLFSRNEHGLTTLICPLSFSSTLNGVTTPMDLSGKVSVQSRMASTPAFSTFQTSYSLNTRWLILLTSISPSRVYTYGSYVTFIHVPIPHSPSFIIQHPSSIPLQQSSSFVGTNKCFLFSIACRLYCQSLADQLGWRQAIRLFYFVAVVPTNDEWHVFWQVSGIFYAFSAVFPIVLQIQIYAIFQY